MSGGDGSSPAQVLVEKGAKLVHGISSLLRPETLFKPGSLPPSESCSKAGRSNRTEMRQEL